MRVPNSELAKTAVIIKQIFENHKAKRLSKTMLFFYIVNTDSFIFFLIFFFKKNQ